MIHLKSKEEIKIMREANRIIAKTREVILPMVKPGVSTYELDQVAEDTIRSHGAIPGFKGMYDFPATLCIAINEEVVHGIPSKQRILQEGDIIGIDMGTVYKGYYGDSAVTVPVGKISEEAAQLLKVTEEALYKGIQQARPGGHLYDIGAAVSEHAEKHGYSVVRDFVGHGIGRDLHEEPQVPNYGTKGTGIKLQEGMVLAIEPMINGGTHAVKILEDGWTVVTKDGMLSAHFEHSIAITGDGPVILSVL
ncbi:MAG: type I methionyl aminopeptidase [Deltaproteobacteria bacterium]|nr:type I methionyl aminopeptidase [Deltaproteobacteria bacterium]